MGKPGMESWAAKARAGQRWNEEDARGALLAWAASGEPLSTFAQKMGLVPQRLSWWRERLGEGAPARGKEVVVDSAAEPLPWSRLVPVTVRDATLAVGGNPGPVVVVSLPEGVRIEVQQVGATPPGWVAQLVRELREVKR